MAYCKYCKQEIPPITAWTTGPDRSPCGKTPRGVIANEAQIARGIAPLGAHSFLVEYDSELAYLRAEVRPIHVALEKWDDRQRKKNGHKPQEE